MTGLELRPPEQSGGTPAEQLRALQSYLCNLTAQLQYAFDTLEGREGTEKIPAIGGGAHYIRCAMPILSEGDIVGCVVSLAAEGKEEHPAHPEAETKLIQTAAGFLGKQLES